MPGRNAMAGAFLMVLGILFPAAEAGHELPYYPSYYPQEIRLEALEPGVAARRLQDNTLHAYVGSEPLFATQRPDHVDAITVLGSYMVATFNSAAVLHHQRQERCAEMQELLAELAGPVVGYVFHPYPVTPYHWDYLHHFDRATAVQAQFLQRPAGAQPAPTLSYRVRVR